jgi:hypothetical protein
MTSCTLPSGFGLVNCLHGGNVSWIGTDGVIQKITSSTTSLGPWTLAARPDSSGNFVLDMPGGAGFGGPLTVGWLGASAWPSGYSPNLLPTIGFWNPFPFSVPSPSGPAIPASSAYASVIPNGVTSGLNGTTYFSSNSSNGWYTIYQMVLGGSAPLWTASVTHGRNFTQGESSAAFSIDVADAALSGASAKITVRTQPGLTLASLSGSGWSCSANSCSQTSTPGTITALVNVAADAPAQQTLTVNVAAVHLFNSPPQFGGFGSDTVTIGPSCNLPVPALAPVTFPVAGGTASVNVTTGAACSWSADNLPEWLGASPASGTGPATVTLTASANTGPARSASPTFGAQSLTVTQAAAPTIIVSATPASVTAGSGTVLVSLSGTGFPPGGGTVWTWGTQQTWLPTWYFGPTLLVVSVPASLLTSPGSAWMVYWKPDGTSSNSVAFTVSAKASGQAVTTVLGSEPRPSLSAMRPGAGRSPNVRTE